MPAHCILPYRTVKPQFLRLRRCGSSSLRSVPSSMARQCLFRALHSQPYSFQRGGGGPGPLLSSFVLPPIFGSLFVSEPAPNLKTDPTSPARARTILEISCVAMPVIGLRTLDARPPAMWFSASNKTTIKPNDQSRSNYLYSRYSASAPHSWHFCSPKLTPVSSEALFVLCS